LFDTGFPRGSGLNRRPIGGKGFASHGSAPMLPELDVFTADEIARAAGVPREVIHRLLQEGTLRPVPGSVFFDTGTAVHAARRARQEAAALRPGGSPVSPGTREEKGASALASSVLHGVVLALLVWTTSGAADIAATTPRERLVFLGGPGPGGGGGGGGRAPRAPVKRIERPQPTVSETPAPPDPEPLPSRTAIAPVALVAGDEKPEAPETDGTGPGVGAGTDDGTGGGAGGGPFRPGGGIEPPRLLREVKAQYTDEARRSRITGDVLLEIVIKSDGSVGDVKVLRGLGSGLDERAVTAVRNWRFAPARRLGAAVDVIVEVEVEFSLR
jgi:protein TonB